MIFFNVWNETKKIKKLERDVNGYNYGFGVQLSNKTTRNTFSPNRKWKNQEGGR